VAVGVLQRFERRVEDLVNGAFARAFKAEVQPVEIASALQRECDERAAIVARGHTLVPNSFTVALGPTDHERLAVYAGPLGDELADLVREHAREQGYSFVGPVSVAFELAEDLETGRLRVRSNAVAGPTRVAPLPARTSGAYLEVNGARVALAGERTILGRAADSDVRIDDPGMSRRHAEIRLTGGSAVIVDLGSTNGIVVDGQRTLSSELADGSRIQLGSTAVVYRAGQG